jgi:hypothetical protein
MGDLRGLMFVVGFFFGASAAAGRGGARDDMSEGR